jgi:hypothetical protein
VSEIEVEKEEIVTFTIKLSKERAKHIEQWLHWAYAVWSQMEQYPVLANEVFDDMASERRAKVPNHKLLNYDTLLLVRDGLRK